MNMAGLSLERTLYWLREQRRFMAERGTTLAGYMSFYGQYERGEDEIAAIHQADTANLNSLSQRARQLETAALRRAK